MTRKRLITHLFTAALLGIFSTVGVAWYCVVNAAAKPGVYTNDFYSNLGLTGSDTRFSDYLLSVGCGLAPGFDRWSFHETGENTSVSGYWGNPEPNPERHIPGWAFEIMELTPGVLNPTPRDRGIWGPSSPDAKKRAPHPRSREVVGAGWPARALFMACMGHAKGRDPILRGVVRAPTWFTKSYTPYPHRSFNMAHESALDPVRLALPVLPMWRGFLIDTLVFAAAWGIVLFAPGTIRRALRRREGCCVHCHYDLHGLPLGAVCPECGRGRMAATTSGEEVGA